MPEALSNVADKESLNTSAMELSSGAAGVEKYKKFWPFLMKALPRNGLIPRGISLKSGDRIALLFQQIECPSLKLCSEEKP